MGVSNAAATDRAPLSEIVSSASLPAMPDSAMRVLEISGDPASDAADLAKPIEADAALAAQLLKFGNSSYFGFRHTISSVPQAIALLGIDKIKNFVLWTAVFRALPDPKRRGFSMMTFRCDALRRGVFARALAGRVGVDETEDVFTAALLQDVALPVLIGKLGDPYLDLVPSRSESDARLAELEAEAFGWDHADAACELFRGWGLPDRLADLVAPHTRPEQLLAGHESPPAALPVAVSSLLPAFGDTEWADLDRFEACWERLSFTDATTPEDFLGGVDELFDDLASALNAGSKADSLSALYDDAFEDEAD